MEKNHLLDLMENDKVNLTCFVTHKFDFLDFTANKEDVMRFGYADCYDCYLKMLDLMFADLNKYYLVDYLSYELVIEYFA